MSSLVVHVQCLTPNGAEAAPPILCMRFLTRQQVQRARLVSGVFAAATSKSSVRMPASTGPCFWPGATCSRDSAMIRRGLFRSPKRTSVCVLVGKRSVGEGGNSPSPGSSCSWFTLRPWIIRRDAKNATYSQRSTTSDHMDRPLHQQNRSRRISSGVSIRPKIGVGGQIPGRKPVHQPGREIPPVLLIPPLPALPSTSFFVPSRLLANSPSRLFLKLEKHS